MNSRIRIAKNASVNLVDYDENVDEILHTKWDLKSKLDSNYTYDGNFVKRHFNGIDFNLESMRSTGFTAPVYFEQPTGLGLTLPPRDFSVDDVAVNVGQSRLLDVVDVRTQDAIGMRMRDWCRYYKCPRKRQLLNVISLEYSQSRLDSIIKAPDVVLQLDWLENCWPQKCRDITLDNKSYLKTLTYPKVRKYCLMSVAGCFTDFHIDLGGTSVWYHIFKGEKIFWIIPPTDANLILYEKWCLSSEQSSCFFPDLVTECEKVHLKEGNTFMIPSGWIHGVYTPSDSLVFGGNFLHSLSIPLQLRIWNVEENIKVSTKYRYPFFIEMHWYALATCVSSINGKSYMKNTDLKDDTMPNLRSLSNLYQYEINGIRYIYQWLKHVSFDSSKSLPADIDNPAQLMSDAEMLCNSFLANDAYDFQDNEDAQPELGNPLKNEHFHNSAPSNCEHDSPAKYMKLEIAPILVKDEQKGKVRKPYKTRKLKAELTSYNAEIPHELFYQITQRTGSRQIVRPNRLVEHPIYK